MPGFGGPDQAADLQPVDLLGGADRGEPVHPPEHGGVALLRADELAGGREEPDISARSRSRRGAAARARGPAAVLRCPRVPGANATSSPAARSPSSGETV